MLEVLPEKERLSLQQELDGLIAKPESGLVERIDELLSACYASPFVKRVCVSQPQWLGNLFSGDELQRDTDRENFEHELGIIFSQANSVDELQRLLRQARAAAFARIAWRDFHGYSNVDQTLTELSLFAEVC